MRKRFFIVFALLVVFILTPISAKAANLFLSPSSASQTVGDSFGISVRVNTENADINAAQATISFSNDILEVTSLSQAGIFSLWPVTPTYSNASGTITFAGGVPGGYIGSSGTIILITFHAKAVGTASASIGSASVLANDGFGTDLLTWAGSGSYTISAPGEEPGPGLGAPVISSSTHSEQILWYADSNPSFEWSREEGVIGFSFVFDDQPETIPDGTRDSTDNSVDYTGTGDGIWYFHVRAQNNDGWGPAGHFRVQIDTIPPLPFDIELLDGSRTFNPTPRISFSTTDETSGIHHYDLITDAGEPVGIDVGQTTPYIMPNLTVGKHEVTAIAYDYASNTTEASNSFIIASPSAIPPVVVEEEEKPLADKISEILDEILPAPLREITRAIGDTLQRLRQSEVVNEVVDNIIEPIMTTTAVVAATSLAATVATTINFYNLLYLFFRFGYFWLIPITLGKKRKRWGVVFDSITGKPVPRAVVRIFTREFNKLKESQITDAQGRFGFLIDQGKYYVAVTAPGYIFPSRILKTASISQYDDIYRGDTVEVKDETGGVLSMNIPIDPNMREVSQSRLTWLKLLSIIGFFLEKISLPLLVAGTFLSWISLIIDPAISNYFILSIYGLLIILRYAVTKKFGRSIGLVRDKETRQLIEMAIVRIYNAESGSIVGTRVTNRQGQFNALLAPGKYYLVIVKSGYENFQSKPVTVSKYRGYIRFTAELKPKTKPEPPTLEEKGRDQDIHLEAEPIKTVREKSSQSSGSAPSIFSDTDSEKQKNKKSSSQPSSKKTDKKPPLPSDLGTLSEPDKD